MTSQTGTDIISSPVSQAFGLKVASRHSLSWVSSLQMAGSGVLSLQNHMGQFLIRNIHLSPIGSVSLENSDCVPTVSQI